MCTSEALSPAAVPGPSPSPEASVSAPASTSTDQKNDNIPASPDASQLPDVPVLRHIVDVHCHPTDAPELLTPATLERLQIIMCTMSTKGDDQDRVRGLAEKYPDKIVPGFGYHPWWSHLISTTDDPEPDKETHYRRLFLPDTLPDSSQTKSKPTPPDHESAFTSLLQHLPPPRPLSSILTELRTHFTLFPNAMLGEVGLDRIFRVPIQYRVPGQNRELTPFTIPLDHQLKILKAQ
jgi:Tat protein secretion system quality control protein TatD with DNase activity